LNNFAIGTALLDALNTSIKTVKEAKEVFGHTLLHYSCLRKSEKPNLYNGDPEQSASKLVVRDAPRSPISEMYRMMQANLKFLSSDKDLKVIVTSSVPQGCICHLASHGQSGASLADADMRLPSA